MQTEALIEARHSYELCQDLDCDFGLFANLVAALVRAGEVEEAVDLYRQRLAAGRVCFQSGDGLAETLAEAGDLDRALDLCRETARVAAVAPRVDAWARSVSLCFMGQLLREAGLQEEALAVYREAVELAPRNPHAHYDYGETLAEADRVAEAREQWQRALALDTTTLKRELREKLETTRGAEVE